MRIVDSFLEELNLEAATTRRVLERVPEAHLGWQPHQKSMSLGQLATHVATLPGLVREFLAVDVLDFDSVPKDPPTIASHADLLAVFASSIDQARSYLAALSDDRATSAWRLVAGERLLLAAPRTAILRSFLFNHWYHHRGQLVVYLRLLDVSVPSVYGPTADENPFADVQQQ
ncbi:MAG TPA: DinB family protein [Vicinamibacterales bacterium]|nr:DinB family protein [Vicinamibacterales bacterium]